MVNMGSGYNGFRPNNPFFVAAGDVEPSAALLGSCNDSLNVAYEKMFTALDEFPLEADQPKVPKLIAQRCYSRNWCVLGHYSDQFGHSRTD